MCEPLSFSLERMLVLSSDAESYSEPFQTYFKHEMELFKKIATGFFDKKLHLRCLIGDVSTYTSSDPRPPYCWHRENTSWVKINHLSANFTKWSNLLKQFIANLPTNCLSVFDHFVGLALKGLKKQPFADVLQNSFFLILQYWQENTCLESLFNIVACQRIEGTPTHLFTCESWKSFFHRPPPTAASEIRHVLKKIHGIYFWI